MDLKRTANVKQMLRNALFHRQSCAGKGSRRRKSNRGSGTAFLHVLTRNHHISSCTVALLQRWAVDGNSSLQASTGPCGDSPVLWPPVTVPTVPIVPTTLGRRRPRNNTQAHTATGNAAEGAWQHG